MGISWGGRAPRTAGGSRGVPSVGTVSILVAPRTTPRAARDPTHRPQSAAGPFNRREALRGAALG